MRAVGVQNITYFDDSEDEYGMTDDKESSTGAYADLQVSLDFLNGTNFSVAVRNDFHDPFDDELIWKYGFRQELPGGFYLRSNGGTSYSNPTLTEIGARQGQVVNSELQTQAVETYSLGFGINGEAMGGWSTRAASAPTPISTSATTLSSTARCSTSWVIHSSIASCCAR